MLNIDGKIQTFFLLSFFFFDIPPRYLRCSSVFLQVRFRGEGKRWNAPLILERNTPAPARPPLAPRLCSCRYPYRANIPIEIVPIDPGYNVNEHYCGIPGYTEVSGGTIRAAVPGDSDEDVLTYN